MLKKLLFSTALFSVFTFTSQAQVYEKGDMIVDAYFGGPNLFSSVVKDAYKNDATFGSGVKLNSIGPIGARYEYVLSKRIGLGVNVNYANTSVKGTTTEETYDNATDTYTTNTYDYKASVPRLRIMGTFNLHLGNSEKFDPYFLFGLGYGSFKFKETTTDPNYVSVSIKNPIPVAFRAEYGMRYFFTDHFGLHVQFGLGGGPLVGGGLSFKF